MNGVNYYAFFSLITIALYALFITFYIIPLQLKEVFRPRDWLTPLRVQLLVLFVLSIVSIMPAVAYQYLRANGLDSELLRNVANVASGLSRLITIYVLILIYNYRGRK